MHHCSLHGFIHRKCPFDLIALKTLKYEEDLEKNPDITDLGKFLQIFSNIISSETLATNDLDISTGTMLKLKHLTISGISPYSIVNAIPWLSQLTSKSQLRTLVLKFSFGNLKLARNEQPLRTWKDLDDTVDNLPVLNLERIEIKIPNPK